MEIRIRKTGQVVYEQEFRNIIKNEGGPTWDVTTEEILNQLDADVVFEGPQATGGTVYQYSMRQGVEQQSDGKWYTKYVLGPIFTDSDQEAAYKAQKDSEQAKAVRQDRNQKLSECDWTQLADSTANKEVWATYRQALRDITLQSGFPWSVNWPEKP